jgi:hypothetical protein
MNVQAGRALGAGEPMCSALFTLAPSPPLCTTAPSATRRTSSCEHCNASAHVHAATHVLRHVLQMYSLSRRGQRGCVHHRGYMHFKLQQTAQGV